MSKRPVCPNCDFLLARCLCDTLQTIPNKTHLIILQHKTETAHALNTVALMKKSYVNYSLFIGENFSDHAELNSLLATHSKTTALLFPNENSVVLNETNKEIITHLIVLDGTWKKAQKIFLLSTNLHSLRCVKLSVNQKSLYKIRASKIENSLSTLEASTYALNILEKDLDTSSLVKSFEKMIEFQLEKMTEKMGEETVKKNYNRE